MHKLKKDFMIPLLQCKITVAFGTASLNEIDKLARKLGYSGVPEHMKGENGASGFTVGSVCWIRDVGDLETLFHELSHVMDSVYSRYGLSEEREFRAYLQGSTYERVFHWWSKIISSV